MTPSWQVQHILSTVGILLGCTCFCGASELEFVREKFFTDESMGLVDVVAEQPEGGLLVLSGSGIRRLTDDGILFAYYPFQHVEELLAHLQLCELGEQAQRGILANVPNQGMTFFYNLTGRPLWRIPTGWYQRARAADLTGDGIYEVLASTRRQLTLYDATGAKIRHLGIRVGDFRVLRGSGVERIVAKTSSWGGDSIVVLGGDGKVIHRWRPQLRNFDFVVGEWPPCTDKERLYLSWGEELLVTDLKGEVERRLHAPRGRGSTIRVAVPFRSRSGDALAAVLLSGRGGTRHYSLIIFDESGRRVYEDHGANNALALLVRKDASGGEEILVGSRDVIWRYREVKGSGVSPEWR